MTSQNDNKTEILVEAILQSLGQEGALYEDLKEDEIEAIIANSSNVAVSESFKERALKKMREAQTKRVANLPSVRLGTMFAQARQQLSLGLKDIREHTSVAEDVIMALELGQLQVGQIIHNFGAVTMAKLLRFLKLDFEDFSSLLLDSIENAGKRSGFSEAKAAYRKHTSDDMNALAEVTEYLAKVEAKLK